jgi:hypothetical protein
VKTKAELREQAAELLDDHMKMLKGIGIVTSESAIALDHLASAYAQLEEGDEE